MMRALKTFDRPVLNFFDLHNDFSPIELFSQIDSFIDFAEVHCLPLQSHLRNKEGNLYPAVCLTKKFWLAILRRTEWSSNKTLGEMFNEISGNDPDTRKEVEDARIVEKLSFISRNSQQNSKNVILMLAIAELAEIDSTKLEASQWNFSSEDITNSDDEIQEFNCGDGKVNLIASEHIYRYYYYDGEDLSENSAIVTVKIEAKGSLNQFAKVKIELYSEALACCVLKLDLKQGEYVYCNVADGKIIKFLPNISINDEMCLLRENYTNSLIKVFTKGAEEWTVRVEDVSSFATGTRHDGFIMLKNGKINHSFYEPAKDYFERVKLDMIFLPVVEALIYEGGYKFLLSNGTIKSNGPLPTSNRKVSLSSAGRYPFPEVKGCVSCKEAAISSSGQSAAIITNDDNKRFYVQFIGENNGLRIHNKKIELI